jgi:hypothetical protein
MNTSDYPPSHLNHLAKRIKETEVKSVDRNWTGNDESKRNHNGVVYLNESPLTLCLSWKTAPNQNAKLIGIFELDLRKLLNANYVRPESSKPDAVRLRFYHGYDNVIYIQVNNKEPRLPVGKF